MEDDPNAARLRSDGELAFRIGKLGEACHFYRRALRCYKQVGDRLAQGYCLRRLGQILLTKSHAVRNYGASHRTSNSSDYRKLAAIAGKLFEAAATRYQNLGDEVGVADCVIGSAEVALECSHGEQARQLFEQSLEVLLRHEECESKQADCLVGLADVARRQCSNEEAMWLYRDAESLYSQSERYDGRANCHLSLGDIALEGDKLSEANARYFQAFEYYQKVRSAVGTMHSLHALGDVALRFEFFDSAAVNYAKSMDLARRCSLTYTFGLLSFKVACCLVGKSRRAYAEQARIAWLSIGREDLIRQWLGD